MKSQRNILSPLLEEGPEEPLNNLTGQEGEEEEGSWPVEQHNLDEFFEGDVGHTGNHTEDIVWKDGRHEADFQQATKTWAIIHFGDIVVVLLV